MSKPVNEALYDALTSLIAEHGLGDVVSHLSDIVAGHANMEEAKLPEVGARLVGRAVKLTRGAEQLRLAASWLK